MSSSVISPRSHQSLDISAVETDSKFDLYQTGWTYPGLQTSPISEPWQYFASPEPSCSPSANSGTITSSQPETPLQFGTPGDVDGSFETSPWNPCLDPNHADMMTSDAGYFSSHAIDPALRGDLYQHSGSRQRLSSAPTSILGDINERTELRPRLNSLPTAIPQDYFTALSPRVDFQPDNQFDLADILSLPKPVSRGLISPGPNLLPAFDDSRFSTNAYAAAYATVGSSGSHDFGNSISNPSNYSEASQDLGHQSQMVTPMSFPPHDGYVSRPQSQGSRLAKESSISGFPSVSDFEAIEMLQPLTPLTHYFPSNDDDEWRPAATNTLPEKLPERPLRSVERQTRSRRRQTMRQRRATSPRRSDCFSTYTSLYGTECRFEGRKFRLEGDLFNGHYTWVPEESPNTSKTHRCPHVNENGKRCDVGFERSEHLKRHVDNCHSNERKYPCPLPSCVDKKGNHRRIGRSDNAGDHFKTHLRPKPRGRRNPQYDWPTVRMAILDAYDTKRATKLIDGLQRWINAGMPEPGELKKQL